MFSMSPVNIAFITTEGEAFVGTLPKHRNKDKDSTVSVSDKGKTKELVLFEYTLGSILSIQHLLVRLYY